MPLLAAAVFCFSISVFAQQAEPAAPAGKPAAPVKELDKAAKKNQRPTSTEQPQQTRKREPFEGASIAELSGHCVALQTDLGDIDIEVAAEAAPETSRNFLNLAATGAFDETTFSRVVPKFVVQGGNLATGQKWTLERAQRASRTVPDEPNYIKHVRGVVSLARPDEPNKGSTHFFVLVNDAPSLDGKFAAFGRVVRGMEVVDSINQAPVDGDSPQVPVVIKRATVAKCR
jgi:peptidyl-prolyl cis-trans isomerase B (cyclophilin B)